MESTLKAKYEIWLEKAVADPDLKPELEAEAGAFALRGERSIPVSSEVAAYLRSPAAAGKNPQIALDAARAIGVFYRFHLDSAPEVRRSVLGMVSKNKEGMAT